MACAALSVCFAFGQAATLMGNMLTSNLIIQTNSLAALVIIRVFNRNFQRLSLVILPSLCLLALLDTLAFAFVTGAGHYPEPHLVCVAASTFGMVTIILARVFLREHLTSKQWLAVNVVFGAIFYLRVTIKRINQ